MKATARPLRAICIALALVSQAAPDALAQAFSQGAEILSRRQAQIERFVTNYYLSSEPFSKEQIEVLYAPRIHYFGKSDVGREEVIRDKLRYYARWPSRRYVLDPATLQVAEDPANPRILDIRFEYEFDVSAPSRTSGGRGIALLTLDLSVEGGRITRETGSVISRR